MEFRILGPLEVLEGGSPLPLGGGRQRALFALLLLQSNQVVSVERLIDELWGERPPRTAANLVQLYVSRLRKALPAGARKRLVTRGRGYLLRVEEGELDLERFQRLSEQGRRALAQGEPERASALLGEALALWRGPALSDCSFPGAAESELARLEELRLAALEERIEAELACGRQALVVGELEALVREQPFRERPRAQLMLALYRAGRQAEALELYRQTRRSFVQELGLEPGQALQELERQILAQDPALAAPAPPPAEAVGARPTLPVPATPLVGRGRELQEVLSLLRGDCRLLTLTGTGGTGKTRLALEAASALAEDFPDGAWWVSLERVRDPEHVVPAIAEALGVDEPLDRYLAEREALLLLDSFEHVLDAAAAVSSLLTAALRLRFLVTSREPLRLAAERECPVPPLQEDEAVSLFLERARAVRPDFAADGVVAEICRRLDHLPLALELAAPRVRMLSPELLLRELEHRFEVLTGGPRDAPRRQQSLRATLDWSYALLTAAERAALARLSVFVGGFTIEAAEDVCDPVDDVFAVFASLVEKNLVRRTDDLADEPRFALLETIREYAAERLGHGADAERARRRHAHWYLGLADELYRQVSAFDPASHDRARARYSSERANLHAALAWFTQAGDTGARLRLAGCLELWLPGRVTEGRSVLAELLEQTAGAPSPGRLHALRTAALLALLQHDAEEALPLAEEAVALARREDDDVERLAALLPLQMSAVELDDARRAQAAAEEGEQLAGQLGNWSLVAAFIINRAYLDATHGRYASAKRGFTEALSVLLEKRGLEATRAVVMQNLGLVALEEGRLAEAADLVAGAVRLLDPEIASYDPIRHDCVESFAAIATAAGDHRAGARLAAAAQRWRNEENARQLRWEQGIHDRMTEAIRAVLRPDKLRAAREAGGRMGLGEALAEALTWNDGWRRPTTGARRRQRGSARRAPTGGRRAADR